MSGSLISNTSSFSLNRRYPGYTVIGPTQSYVKQAQYSTSFAGGEGQAVAAGDSGSRHQLR